MTYLDVVKADLTRPDAIYLIMNDESAKTVLNAWQFYGVKFKETPAVKGEDVRATLLRWWTEIGLDLSRLAAIAGLPVTRVTKIFFRLCATYLVWPDGTVSSDARSVIIGERNAKLRELIAKQPTTAKEEKGKTDDGKRTASKSKKAHRKS